MRTTSRTRSLILLLLAAIILLLVVAPFSASSVGLSFWAVFFLPTLFFIAINFRRALAVAGSVIDARDRTSRAPLSRFQRPPPLSIA
ncbi:MAG: hypothetical protein WBY53_13735 [Acidobacteriaceae bacterium]